MKQSLINFAFLTTGAAAIFFIAIACLFTSLWLMIPATLNAVACGYLTEHATIGREDA